MAKNSSKKKVQNSGSSSEGRLSSKSAAFSDQPGGRFAQPLKPVYPHSRPSDKATANTPRAAAPLNTSSSNTPQESSASAKSPYVPSASVLEGAKKHQERLKRIFNKKNCNDKRSKNTVENKSVRDHSKPAQRRRRNSRSDEDSRNNNLENKRRKHEFKSRGNLISLGKSYSSRRERPLKKDLTPKQLYETNYVNDQRMRKGAFKFRVLHNFCTFGRKPRSDRIYGCPDEEEERQRELDEKYAPWTA